MQTLCPLFGEYSTDQAIGRAIGARPGVTAQPTLVAASSGGGATWSLGLGVDPSTGFWAWRTPWTKERGAFQIVEDATVTFVSGITRPAAGLARHILLVGRWRWVSGQIGADGKPLGTFTSAQQAVYEAIQGADSATPADPAVPATDVAGRPGVILARIVLEDTGDPRIEWLASTMLDLAWMGRLLDMMHRRSGLEVHEGKFQVTEAPTEDNDVLRRIDSVEGIARPYANAAFGSIASGATYPVAGGVPIRIPIRVQSGINVEDLLTGGYRAKVKGIYKIDYHMKHHGSLAANDYANFEIRVKRKANEGAGFADSLAHEWDYFGLGNCEAGASVSLIEELEEDDIVGVFCWSGPMVALHHYIVVTYMGQRAPTDVISILNGNLTIRETVSQTYPASWEITLAAQNATGSVVWSIDAAGSGEIDGTTEPKASILTGPSRLKIECTTRPTIPAYYSVKLRAVDDSGNIATKTIAITIDVAAAFTIVTNSWSVSGYESQFPLPVDFAPVSANGVGAITWEVVAGIYTTLPDAAITGGNRVTGNAADWELTYTVRLRATDSSTPTPQVVEKTVNVFVNLLIGGGGLDPECFATGTKVLMADGTTKAIEDVVKGDLVMAVYDGDHQSGLQTFGPSEVTGVEDFSGIFPMLQYRGIGVKADHRWGVINPEEGSRLWTPTAKILPQMKHSAMVEGTPAWVQSGMPIPAGQVSRVHNLQTKAKTYCVVDENGNALLVHNVKILEM